ncbi:MAG: hypothetical protein AAFV80_01760 [Bacteroidota bacterium]
MIYQTFQQQGEELAKATGLKFESRPFVLPKDNPYFEGFQLTTQLPGLYGFYKKAGVLVEMYQTDIGISENEHVYVAFVKTITLSVVNPNNRLLLITRERLKTQIDKGFGKEELIFKDRKFDRNFWIETPFEEWGFNLLDERLRKLFLRNVGLVNGKLMLGDWEVVRQKLKAEKQKKQLEDVLDFEMATDEQLTAELTKEVKGPTWHQQTIRLHPVNIAVNGPMKVSWIVRLIDLLYEVSRKV